MKLLRSLFLICAFVGLFCPNARAQTGLLFRTDCASIAAPVADSTACIQTTTTGGRTANGLYVWNGSAWVAPSNLSGGGTVTSFSAGNLSPLFTSSVATPTTTPALTFSLTNAGANTVFGNATGSSASPSYGQVVTGQLANSAVTLGKIANAAANSKLLGSGAAGSGSPYAELTLGTNLSMSGTTLNAAGGASGCSTSGSSILQGDGAGGCSNVTVGSGLTFSGGTLSATGGSSGLTLIEHKTITSDSTTVTFSGLNGNTDGVYRLVAKIVAPFGSTTNFQYVMRPNGATTNLNSRIAGFYQNQGAFANDSSTLVVAWLWEHATDTVANSLFFTVDFGARANPNSVPTIRPYFVSESQVGTVYTGWLTIGGGWSDNSANVTSIDVVSNSANAILNGSELWLYKYAQ